MRVPLLDLQAQHRPLRDALRRALDETLDSGAYILGPRVAEFERQIAAYLGVAHAIGVSSGTDALLVSLMALDVGAGDVVVTTPYSFFASAGAIARLGATPAFVDIDRATFNLDPAKLEEWLNKHVAQPGAGKRVKAIVPISLFGQSADMDAIGAIAKRHEIPIIEDAAQALSATYPSKAGVRKVGTIGALGCYSFFPSKNLGCLGDGGLVATNDNALAEKVRKLRNHGAHPKYYHALLGGNFRLDAIQAAVLSVKLPHLDGWSAARRRNAAYYDERLTSEFVTRPSAVFGREHHIYNQYVIAVRERRDDLRAYLTERGVGCEVYYPLPFHEQEVFRGLGYRVGDFPHSEWAARHTLALPIYPELTPEMQDYVVECVGAFYESAGLRDRSGPLGSEPHPHAAGAGLPGGRS